MNVIQKWRLKGLRPMLKSLAVRACRRELFRAPARLVFPLREPKQWIFPVGCYNSGTTFLQELLAAHPDVRSLPAEGAFLTSVLPKPEDLGWNRMWVGCPDYMKMEPRPEPRKVRRLKHDWSLWWGPGGAAFMDKSVSNVTRMAWLDLNFSNAFFIGIVRDGYCVAESIRRRARPAKQALRQAGPQYSLEWTARQWLDANQRLLRESSQRRRFRMIRYEDLVDNPAAVLTDLWGFLKLPPAPLRDEGEHLAVGDRRVRVFREANSRSLSRLDESELTQIAPLIEAMRQRLGYGELTHAGVGARS